VGVAVLAIAIPPCAGAAAAQGASETVEGLHPGLASGVLTFGRLAQLPKDVLLRAGPVALTRADLAKILAGTPDAAQDELERNAFFLLENEATPRLLALAAKAELSADEKKSERQLIEDYLERVTAKVRVGDEEVARFYEENRELLGGAALDAVKQPIRQHLLEGKRQQVVAEHLRTLGQRLKIEVAAAWVEEQAIPAMDNPVDKARRSGKPSLVVFGGACG
jgi:hypothetical protein